jgi:hypothetical protein
VDTYGTDDIGRGGFHARSVVGGIFIKALTDPELWEKWASRDHFKAGPWAALPDAPR